MKLIPSLLIFSCLSCFGQKPDSVVRTRELRFHSEFEKYAILNALKTSSPDYSALFLANSPTPNDDQANFQTKFKTTLQEIKQSDGWAKKNERKVKLIYQIVHNRFLIKYSGEVSFYHLVKTGTYNCVTASALFAFFFDALSIPYTIKEKPTHIYLVAFPGTENILVETTTPISGFLAFDPAFKSSFVENLQKQKIIGGSDLNGKTKDELFDAYFFADENIGLRQLVGIHYSNESIFLANSKDLKKSYDQIKKAYLFYPNDRSEYLLMASLASYIQETGDAPLEKAELIGQASRLTRVGITKEMIQGDFMNLTQEVLQKKNDKALYQRCYQQITEAITSPEMRDEVSYIFNYENGRVFYNQGNYQRAKQYFGRALTLQPNNVDLGGVFVSSLGLSLRNVHDPTEALDTLLYYKKRYESLSENVNFLSMVALAHGMLFGQLYDKGDLKGAEDQQKKFETLYFGDVILSQLDNDVIAHSYASGASYFFKKGMKTKAKAMIEQGLKIVPNSYELKSRRQMLNNQF